MNSQLIRRYAISGFCKLSLSIYTSCGVEDIGIMVDDNKSQIATTIEEIRKDDASEKRKEKEQ